MLNLKPDAGLLFKNDEKQKDTQPDYKGELNLGGKYFYVSAWVNTSKKNGKPYLSLSLKEKQPSKKDIEGPNDAANVVDPDLNDDIPW